MEQEAQDPLITPFVEARRSGTRHPIGLSTEPPRDDHRQAWQSCRIGRKRETERR